MTKGFKFEGFAWRKGGCANISLAKFQLRAKGREHVTAMVFDDTSKEGRVHRLALIASCALVLCASASVQTQAKQGDSAATTGRKPSFGMYVPPNEQHPAAALPIWKQSNHGAYVSVGTERSFMALRLHGRKRWWSSITTPRSWSLPRLTGPC